MSDIYVRHTMRPGPSSRPSWAAYMRPLHTLWQGGCPSPSYRQSRLFQQPHYRMDASRPPPPARRRTNTQRPEFGEKQPGGRPSRKRSRQARTPGYSAASSPRACASSRALGLTDGRKGTSQTCARSGRPGSLAYSSGSQTSSSVPTADLPTGT